MYYRYRHQIRVFSSWSVMWIRRKGAKNLKEKLKNIFKFNIYLIKSELLKLQNKSYISKLALYEF